MFHQGALCHRPQGVAVQKYLPKLSDIHINNGISIEIDKPLHIFRQYNRGQQTVKSRRSIVICIHSPLKNFPSLSQQSLAFFCHIIKENLLAIFTGQLYKTITIFLRQCVIMEKVYCYP